MEGDGFTGRNKRSGDFNSDERPWKLKRQGEGSGCVSDGMDWEANMSRTLPTTGVVSGDRGASSPSCVFIDASPRAAASFDFSELTGVVFLEELVGGEDTAEPPPADVYVPGAARRVPIANQLILSQILRRLRLELHGFGVVVEPCGLVRGWVEIDTPPSGVQGLKGRQRFLGGQRGNKYDALESASMTAITELRLNHSVIVKDLSFAKVKRLEQKLFVAIEWENLYRMSIDSKNQEIKKIKTLCSDLLMEAKFLCKNFSDILPVGTGGVDSLEVAFEDAQVMYAGVRPPITRLEELAQSLVNLINKGSISSASWFGKI